MKTKILNTLSFIILNKKGIIMKDDMMIASVVFFIVLLALFIGLTALSMNTYETTGSILLAITMLIEGIFASITTVSVWLIISYEMSRLTRRHK